MPLLKKGDKILQFSNWGLARHKAGFESDYHFHDCDEWWFIIKGKAKAIEDGKEYELNPGDVLFTHMGSEHKFIAVSETVHFWLEGPLRGKKRPGHLHKKV